jgi:hypothetical protein
MTDPERSSQRDAVALARAYLSADWESAVEMLEPMDFAETQRLATAATSLFGMAVQRVAHHIGRSSDDVFDMILAGIDTGQVQELEPNEESQ